MTVGIENVRYFLPAGRAGLKPPRYVATPTHAGYPILFKSAADCEL